MEYVKHVVILLTLVISTSPCHSLQLLVSPGGNDSLCAPCQTLSAAIANSSFGAQISVTAGTYSGLLNKQLLISRDLTFVCPAGGCILDCGGSGPAATILNSTVSLHGFVIENCVNSLASGGALSILSSSVALNGIKFKQCSSSQGGGAVHATHSNVFITNSTFFRCSAGSGGAVLASHGSTVTVSGSVIANCTAHFSGGGLSAETHSNVTTTNSRFLMCNSVDGSQGMGGALYVAANAALAVYHSQAKGGRSVAGGCLAVEGSINLSYSSIVGCSAAIGGGAWISGTSASATIVHSTFNGNLASVSGGGLYGTSIRTLSAVNTNFSSNTAGTGGGGAAAFVGDSGSFWFRAVSVVDGSANGNGGGLYFSGEHSITLSSVVITNCIARQSGSGGCVYSMGGVLRVLAGSSMRGCSTSGGSGGGGGGGLLVNSGSAEVSNSSFIDCYSSDSGGAIWVGNSSTLVLTGLLFESTTAASFGGAVTMDSSALIASGCRFWSATASSGGAIYSELGRLHVSNSTFNDCIAYDFGGAVALHKTVASMLLTKFIRTRATSGGAIDNYKSQLLVSHCLLTACRSSRNGGSILTSGDITVASSVFVASSAGQKGGSIFSSNTKSKVVMIDCIVHRSSSLGEGGAWYTRANIRILGTTFSHCTSNTHGGAVYAYWSTLIILSSQFKYCHAERYGGGVYSIVGSVSLTAVTMHNNTAGSVAGALRSIYFFGFTLTNCTFTSNYAPLGGAIAISRKISSRDPYTITGSTLRGNSAAKRAGAVLLDTSTKLVLTNSMFEKNFCAGDGGAMFVVVRAVLDLRQGNMFRDNFAGGTGGAVRVQDTSSLVGTGPTSFIGNAARFGGAIFLEKSRGSLTNALFQSNFAVNSGGGLAVSRSTLSMRLVNFYSNSAQNGGAVTHLAGSSVIMTAINVFANSASGNGGGMLVSEGAAVVISASLFKGNTALQQGGAIALLQATLTSGGALLLTSNTAHSGGGLAATLNAQLQLYGTKLQNNTASGMGGGLFAELSSSVFAARLIAVNNTAIAFGGAFAVVSCSSMRLSALSLVEANTVGLPANNGVGGGGIYLSMSTVHVGNSSITNNVVAGAGSAGGGVSARSSSRAWILHGTMLTNNQVTSGGGGGLHTMGSQLTVLNASVSKNSVGDQGGGMLCTGGSIVNLTSTTIGGNTATAGGGAAILATTLWLRGTYLTANEGMAMGGGLYTGNATTMVAVDSHVTENRATFGGGWFLSGHCGVFSGAYSLTGSTISDNSACRGGGLFCAAHNATVRLASSKFVQNHALVKGSEILCESVVGCSILGAPAVRAECARGTVRKLFVNSSDTTLATDGGGSCCGNMHSPCQSVSAAVSNATTGDTIELSPGTYSGSGNRGITLSHGFSITIQSAAYDVTSSPTGPAFSPISYGSPAAAGGGCRVIIDLQNSHTPFIAATSGSKLALFGITIVRGTGDGSVQCHGARINLTSTILGDNAIHRSGPARCLFAASCKVSVQRSLFVRCTAAGAGRGGGAMVLSKASSGILHRCVFRENSAVQGGAITVTDSSLVLHNCVLGSNDADNRGGALFIKASQVSIVDGSVLANNTAALSGGAVFLTTKSNLVIASSVLTRNRASLGGAVYTFLGSLQLMAQAHLVGNTAVASGGALYLSSSSLTATNVYWSLNAAGASGGGAFLERSTADVRDSLIGGNSALGTGGGLALNQGRLTLTGGMLSSNSAQDGGGFFAIFSQVQIHSSGVLRNRASAEGGGIQFVISTLPLALLDAKFSDNSAGRGGAVAAAEYAVAEMVGCSFTGNRASAGGGGGLYLASDVNGGSASLSSCVFTSNRALAGQSGPQNGGAVLVDGTTVLGSTSSIFQGNAASGRGGALFSTATVRLSVANASFSSNLAAEVGQKMYTQGNCTRFPGWVLPPGSLNCYRCGVGSYSWIPGERIDRACHGCPVGAYCAGGAAMMAREGNWRFSQHSLVFLECLEPKACLGARPVMSQCQPGDLGNVSSFCGLKENCARGYEGNLCHQCVHGYARRGTSQCVRCRPSFWQYLLIPLVVLTLVGVLVFTSYSTIKARGEPKKLSVMMIKILCSHLQQISAIASYGLNWPSVMTGIFALSSTTSSAGDDVLTLDCIFPNLIGHSPKVFQKGFVTIMLPWVCLVGNAAIWLIVSRTSHSLGRRLSFDRAVTCSLVICFYLHPTVAVTTFQFFTCRELVPGQWYLNQDLDVPCFGPVHSSWLGVGYFGLFFVFGVPVAAAGLLWWNRYFLDTPENKVKYGFLYVGFREQFYTWEVVVMLRKITIIAVAVFAAPLGIKLQVYLGIAVPFIALALHAAFTPYANMWLVRLETFGLVTSLSTLYGALYLIHNGEGSLPRLLATIFMFLMNVSNLAYFCYAFYISGQMKEFAADKVGQVKRQVEVGRHIVNKLRRHHNNGDVPASATQNNPLPATGKVGGGPVEVAAATGGGTLTQLNDGRLLHKVDLSALTSGAALSGRLETPTHTQGRAEDRLGHI